MMMEGSASAGKVEAWLPVMFFDGEQETCLGSVVVSPSLNFKIFQSIISEKLALSPHQFCIYLIDPRCGSRIPVTEKIDFSSVSCQNNCFFFVFLKRATRERRRKSREMAEIMQNQFHPPGNVMLLRRDGNTIPVNSNRFSNLDLCWTAYERRVRELKMEKERYLMKMGLAFERLNLETERKNKTETLVCDECLKAERMGRDVGFHLCVYDAVTFGFRSTAGPIARPVKGPSLASYMMKQRGHLF